MTVIVNHELFVPENISDEELKTLYVSIGGWYAFLFFDKIAANKYMIDSILDVIGKTVDVVSLEKERLFSKLKKIIRMNKYNIPYKEKNGLTVEDRIYYTNFDFDFNYKFDKFDKFYNINFKEFEHKYKFEDFENLDLPESTTEISIKQNDLKLFDIDYDSNNLNDKYMMLLNNLKKFYYERAKILHPDKGGDTFKFTELSNRYEELLASR